MLHLHVAGLISLQGIEFGVRHDGMKVGDVELPPWAEGNAVSKYTLETGEEYFCLHVHSYLLHVVCNLRIHYNHILL